MPESRTFSWNPECQGRARRLGYRIGDGEVWRGGVSRAASPGAGCVSKKPVLHVGGDRLSPCGPFLPFSHILRIRTLLGKKRQQLDAFSQLRLKSFQRRFLPGLSSPRDDDAFRRSPFATAFSCTSAALLRSRTRRRSHPSLSPTRSLIGRAKTSRSLSFRAMWRSSKPGPGDLVFWFRRGSGGGRRFCFRSIWTRGGCRATFSLHNFGFARWTTGARGITHMWR